MMPVAPAVLRKCALVTHVMACPCLVALLNP
jgi:hypothetical protein